MNPGGVLAFSAHKQALYDIAVLCREVWREECGDFPGQQPEKGACLLRLFIIRQEVEALCPRVSSNKVRRLAVKIIRKMKMNHKTKCRFWGRTSMGPMKI